jgi:hypothetical protein
MFEAKADTAHNFIYITIKGTLKLEEGREAASAVLEEAKKLQPGFTIIDDLSMARVATPDLDDELRAVQLLLAIMGAKRNIRIVPVSDTGERLRFLRATEPVYETVEVSSLEEAIELLQSTHHTRAPESNILVEVGTERDL